jgi:transketolase
VAWASAIEQRDGPSSLLLSRDPLPFQQRSAEQVAAIARGAYVLSEAAGGTARAVIIATGSEVPVALAAQQALGQGGVPVRVVSMPCAEVFDRQDAGYRDAVLPRGLPRVAVEAGVSDYWRKYVGLEGAVVGIDRFGESAPAGELFKLFGFTAENVAAAVKGVLL